MNKKFCYSLTLFLLVSTVTIFLSIYDTGHVDTKQVVHNVEAKKTDELKRVEATKTEIITEVATGVTREALTEVAKEVMTEDVVQVEDQSLVIVAVGDNLIHSQIIQSGKQKNGGYNYTSLFDGVKEVVQKADIAIINQETILCDESLGYTGYPKFGSPYAIGEAVYDAGFNVILHANNHTMDKGMDGIEDTLEFWKQYTDTKVAGINETKESTNGIVLVEAKGMTVAILNYTYGLNGLKLPKGKEYMVTFLSDTEKMKKDIALAKELSDFVIVCPHWGTEYVYEATTQQEKLTQFFFDHGVDLVLGTHPHVLEPVEWVENKESSKRMLVYYSLGNFISNQDQMPRMVGGMAAIRIVKRDGEVVIDEASLFPLITHSFSDKGQKFVTYFLEDYNGKLAKAHYLNRKKKNTLTMERLTQLCKTILGDWYINDNDQIATKLAMQSYE